MLLHGGNIIKRKVKMTKPLKEYTDRLENELQKVQHQWNALDPAGKPLWDRRRKMNWIDKIDVIAARLDYTDYEVEEAMNDYGISRNLKDYNPDGSYTKAGHQKMFGKPIKQMKVTPTFKGVPLKPKVGRQTVRTENKEWKEAETMNRYVNTLSMDHSINIWTEAAKRGEDPEPVKGKKTFTDKPQVKVQINPKERV